MRRFFGPQLSLLLLAVLVSSCASPSLSLYLNLSDTEAATPPAVVVDQQPMKSPRPVVEPAVQPIPVKTVILTEPWRPQPRPKTAAASSAGVAKAAASAAPGPPAVEVTTAGKTEQRSTRSVKGVWTSEALEVAMPESPVVTASDVPPIEPAPETATEPAAMEPSRKSKDELVAEAMANADRSRALLGPSEKAGVQTASMLSGTERLLPRGFADQARYYGLVLVYSGPLGWLIAAMAVVLAALLAWKLCMLICVRKETEKEQAYEEELKSAFGKVFPYEAAARVAQPGKRSREGFPPAVEEVIRQKDIYAALELAEEMLDLAKQASDARAEQTYQECILKLRGRMMAPAVAETAGVE